MAVLKLTPEQRKLDQQARTLLPPVVLQQIRRIFTPRGMLFFQFYADLKAYELGARPVPDDIRQQFQRLANYLAQITSPVDQRPLSPSVINHLAAVRPQMGMLLGRLAAGRLDDNQTWGKINDVMVPLILEATRDKGLYLAARQYGSRRWATFRKITGRREQVEQLKDTNPDAYAIIHRYNQTLEEIDEHIEKTVLKAGLTPERTFIAGSPVTVAADPLTKERMVYDRDGEVLSVQSYIEKRRAKAEADKLLAAVPEKTQVPIADLRKIDDEEIDNLGGDTEMVSLTDDRAKQGRLTRIFPVKRKSVFISDAEGNTRIEAHQIIVSGRFKGVFLDDMVNGEGRMIEGTAYSFNPTTSRSQAVPVRIDPAQREPYATVCTIPTTYNINGRVIKRNETRLYVKIPSDRMYAPVRQQLRSLSCNSWNSEKGCISSIVWDEHKGHAAGFYFDPKDFGVIQEIIQGMSLSSGALAVVQDYYKDLGTAEEATAKENLAHYSAAQLGGFKTHLKNRDTGTMEPFDLLTVQKKVLAWMDANGNKGVCALGTGIGKTLASIALMQKMGRDGLDAPDGSYTTPTGKTVKTNGRYLFVCPPALRGNLPKEIRSFLHEPDTLLRKVDIMSYFTFSGASRTQIWKDKPWNPAEYVAIFFDESQKLLRLSSKVSQAALKLWHPRKVCMTASPMEKNPMEAYVMAAISNNIPLFGKGLGARKNRSEMRRFKDRFCEVIGGRIVGVKQDPVVKRDLHTWVRKNIFYADKRQVEEFALPALNTETVAVQMHPIVESAYETVTTRFAKTMGGMVAKFRDRGKVTGPDIPSARDKQVERAFTLAFRPIIHLMNDLANAPEKALNTMADIIETRTIQTTTGPKPIPPGMRALLETWTARFSPADLRKASVSVGNPKLDMAEDRIRAKLDKTDGSSRTILFSDDKDLCRRTALHMSQTIVGQHAVGLPGEIQIYDGSGPVQEIQFEIDPVVLAKLIKDPAEQEKILRRTGGISRHTLPFVPRPMRRFPELPAGTGNAHYRKDQWQNFVLGQIISPNRAIRTLTLYGPIYSLGQNLQAFDTVIHLDRDTWNAEMMKQRTARSWRQGQKQPVDEITLDATYSATTKDGMPRGDFDKTLDEIRKYFQEMDADLFNQIIEESMDVDLGAEWKSIKHRLASSYRLDRKMMDLMVSPHVGRSEPPGM